MDGSGNPYACPGFLTWGQLAFLDSRVQNERLHVKPPPGYYPAREPVNNMRALTAMKRRSNSEDSAEARRIVDGFEMLGDNDEGNGE